MGVTIAYRGELADLERIEDFEDRVVDLALEIGGRARVWRSFNDDDSTLNSLLGDLLGTGPGLSGPGSGVIR